MDSNLPSVRPTMLQLWEPKLKRKSIATRDQVNTKQLKLNLLIMSVSVKPNEPHFGLSMSKKISQVPAITPMKPTLLAKQFKVDTWAKSRSRKSR